MRQSRRISVWAASLTLATLAGAVTASAQSVVDKAMATVALAKGPTDKWYGPTTSPAPVADQSIVCIEYLAQDITAAKWCKGAVDGAAKLGWKSTTIDGQGNADGQRRALQARGPLAAATGRPQAMTCWQSVESVVGS